MTNPTYTKLPEEFDININRADGLDITLNSTQNFTGYTFSAYIVPNDGTTANIAITVAAVTTLADGDLRLTCAPALIANLPYGVHNWYLDWTVSAALRRAIVGRFTIYQYGL